MNLKRLNLLALSLILIALPSGTTGLSATTGSAAAQMTPWLQWTFLPQARMDEIVGEASGETAFNHVMAMCGFPRDRKSAEYAGTFAEAQYVLDRLKEYGLAEAAIRATRAARPGTASRASSGRSSPDGRRSPRTGT